MKQSEKLISTIIECAEQLKELGVKREIVNKRWRAKEGGIYWYIDSFCGVEYSTETNHEGDTYRFNCGNYFRTKAEAEAYRQYCLAYKK